MSEKKQRVIFGINGGASFSRMRLEQDGEHLGTVYSGGCNLNSQPREAISDSMRRLFFFAKERFQIDIEDFVAGCLGTAGTDRDREDSVQPWREIFRNLGFSDSQIADIDICSDAEVLLAGSWPDIHRPGSVLIAGTGSVALARQASGKLYKFGGYGHLFGDEGSGYWIAFRIFSEVLKAIEQHKDSPLVKKILASLEQQTDEAFLDASDLVSYLYSRKCKSEIAIHAKILTLELIEADPLARKIAEEAGDHLLDLCYRLKKQCPEPGRRIQLHGGVLKNHFIAERLIQVCEKEETEVRLDMGEETAEQGACILAKRKLQESESRFLVAG